MRPVEQVIEIMRQFSMEEKIKLLAAVAQMIEQDWNKEQNSLYGLCADLGTAPSEEDIAEVRREMWKNFPREDI
jgi:hypothetical protein